jgi:hypothetical protein
MNQKNGLPIAMAVGVFVVLGGAAVYSGRR